MLILYDILLTSIEFCRYAETVEIIYSSVEFNLINIDTSLRFLSLVPPDQVNLIRSLHISWNLQIPVYT